MTAASPPIDDLLDFFLPLLYKIFFSSHRVLSHISVVRKMDSGEREMNPYAIIVTNPKKEYWPSRGSN